MRSDPGPSGQGIARAGPRIASRPGNDYWLRRLRGFRFDAADLQDQLGITFGLLASLEDQLAGSLEGRTGVEIGGHRRVERIARVLGIDHRRHSAHDLSHLALGANPMV